MMTFLPRLFYFFVFKKKMGAEKNKKTKLDEGRKRRRTVCRLLPPTLVKFVLTVE